mmetsp:Transcript_18960/g.40781  ORF Transcript_18960/g.40781 Transcript_18960/m.40781 type:complete len:211 (-) Transcript_18960:771-1403(-)
MEGSMLTGCLVSVVAGGKGRGGWCEPDTTSADDAAAAASARAWAWAWASRSPLSTTASNVPTGSSVVTVDTDCCCCRRRDADTPALLFTLVAAAMAFESQGCSCISKSAPRKASFKVAATASKLPLSEGLWSVAWMLTARWSSTAISNSASGRISAAAAAASTAAMARAVAVLVPGRLPLAVVIAAVLLKPLAMGSDVCSRLLLKLSCSL